MSPQRYKKLQTKLHSTKKELERVRKMKVELDVKEQQLAEELEQLIEEAKQSDNRLFVTEHALLRYFERVLGYDLKEIQDLILPENLKKDAASLGKNFQYPMQNFTVVVKNNKVVSIIKE